MPFFPLPFLTAFFLLFLLIHMALSGKRGLPLLTLLTIGCYALQSVLIGVNWGISPLPRMILPSLAVILPPLTWLSFNSLSRQVKIKAIGAIIAFIAVLLFAINFAAILGFGTWTDIVEIAVYNGFGFALIWQSRSKNLEWMEDQPLHNIASTRQAYFIAGTILLFSATIDMTVAFDIRMNQGRVSSAFVGYANFALLILLIALFFRGRYSRWDTPSPLLSTEPESREGNLADSTHEAILQKLDRAMRESHLYRKENLSLHRMASAIGTPSRQVSSAINHLRAMNVPQYVNLFRIQDACRLLQETDTPITEIVFAVGFTTKSNFNREFLRIMGMSPSVWRQHIREQHSDRQAPADLRDKPAFESE